MRVPFTSPAAYLLQSEDVDLIKCVVKLTDVRPLIPPAQL
jgi:hypothetical protein